ncbi:MAG TPA: PPOX class F420-dependent oxidoreductase [Anaerolineales bacterium]|nr:PPOX class F420-dependent oxidoreductase [Anaerolineales bacterium]HNN14478.1 PPOX class F420-dependent oxidoreductase [Anaerolineales bacterium]
MKEKLIPFNQQQYLNIETFRKNGEGIKTPVWFAQDGESLRIWTSASAGKTKRIRRDNRVRITPSTASGEATGEWTDAAAMVLDAADEIKQTEELFKRKYGLMFNLLGGLGKLRGTKYITIRVDVH